MNLRSPYPYGLLQHGLIKSYPSLAADIKTEIAIIGAGISGALVADQLCKAGHDVVIIDRRHAGMGSTAASTSLLQYEIDTPLRKLVDLVGEKNAFESYLLCRNAIYDLEKICTKLNDQGMFARKPSFQYASFIKDVVGMETEYQLRRQAGFKIRLLGEDEIFKKFGFRKPAGLLSEDGAEADAYKTTHGLLQYWISKGLRVFDNTTVTGIRHHKHEVELTTAENKKVRAKKLVIACGYESQQYIPKKVQELHSTFAIASEPFEKKNFWYKNAMIWETSTPYLYMRATPDNRIMAGGKDIPFTNHNTRDSLLAGKTKSLELSMSRLFPHILFKTDFKWAGSFASTKDGLPYIGSIPQRPHTYFALGFGGNGITFSVIAARIIRDLLAGRKKKSFEMFSFDR